MLNFKGDILRKLSDSSSNYKFPIKLNEEFIINNKIYKKLISDKKKKKKKTENRYKFLTEYTNKFQVLNDCLDCYNESNELYNILNNIIEISKIKLKIGSTMLEFLFNDIALLNNDPKLIFENKNNNIK